MNRLTGTATIGIVNPALTNEVGEASAVPAAQEESESAEDTDTEKAEEASKEKPVLGNKHAQVHENKPETKEKAVAVNVFDASVEPLNLSGLKNIGNVKSNTTAPQKM